MKKKSRWPQLCKVCKQVLRTKQDVGWHQMIKHKDKAMNEIIDFFMNTSGSLNQAALSRYRP